MDKRPIGMFDSGCGGLTVLKEYLKEMPNEDFIYYGDTAHLPYGDKSKEKIIEFSEKIVEFLLSQNVKMIVIACGTASAAAYETLSKKYATGELKYITHPCSADLRAKLATNMQERRQIINFQCNYNETACKFIDELNIKNNWHLQHALNGGEIRVGPYSLDGYDKDLNIVFEYDENKSKHNSLKGQLKDKYRQLYIMEKLKCKFWRYSEKHNLLYEATIEQTKIDIEKLEKIIV